MDKRRETQTEIRMEAMLGHQSELWLEEQRETQTEERRATQTEIWTDAVWDYQSDLL